MLTAIITTAIITFVVSLFTTKWLFGYAVTSLDKKINRLDERTDRNFHRVNNLDQRTSRSLEIIEGEISKRIDKVDEHLHDLIEEGESTHREDMRMLLSLINVESISKNSRDGLILADYFDGSRKISKLDKALPFVPVKARKMKKGEDITEYHGEKLEFTLPEEGDFRTKVSKALAGMKKN